MNMDYKEGRGDYYLAEGRREERRARAFANPCLYCGVDDNETPHEDTEEHRNTSQHQWAVYNS